MTEAIIKAFSEQGMVGLAFLGMVGVLWWIAHSYVVMMREMMQNFQASLDKNTDAINRLSGNCQRNSILLDQSPRRRDTEIMRRIE